MAMHWLGYASSSSEPAPIFARAFHVADAAQAKLWMSGVGSHVVATMPAANTLGRLTHACRHVDLAVFKRHHSNFVRIGLQRREAQFGGDEEEAQLVSNLCITRRRR